jgi:transposase
MPEGRLYVVCPDWKKIKAEYIAGGTSYRKLAKKYDVSLTTLQRYATKEKWTDLRQQAEAKADTKIVNLVSEKQADRASKIIDVADMLLDKITVLAMFESIDTQGLKHLTSALKDLKEIKGFKSDADMREQEARIAKLVKEAEKDDADTNQEVVVTIEGGVNDAWLK